MKRIALIALIGLAGCTSIKGTRSPQGSLALEAHGFLTSTKGLAFSATDQNGFTTTLALQEQTADSTAIQTLSAGIVDLAKTGLLFMGKTQTNSEAPVK